MRQAGGFHKKSLKKICVPGRALLLPILTSPIRHEPSLFPGTPLGLSDSRGSALLTGGPVEFFAGVRSDLLTGGPVEFFAGVRSEFFACAVKSGNRIFDYSGTD